MTPFDAQSIQNRIREVAVCEADLSESAAAEVAFHITDWLNDLEAYARFCSAPNTLSNAEVDRLLTQFLLHVPNHAAAAMKLYTDVPVTDVFGVTATSEESENSTKAG